jgi:hypothetical protein
MKIWLRLGVVAVLLAAIAMGLVYLRTETAREGSRLHALYHRRRGLEKSCWRLHLVIADLKNVDGLRARAAELKGPAFTDTPLEPIPMMIPQAERARALRLAEQPEPMPAPP